MTRDGKVLAFERHKLVRLYVFLMDGGPLFAFESDKDEATALADCNEGLELPKGHKYEVTEAVSCPQETLERLALMMDLKTRLFNMAQISEAVRASKSGIAIARPGGGPLSPQ